MIKTEAKKINVGLPKGFLNEKSLDLIERLLNKKIDKNLLKFKSKGINFYLLKLRDIPVLLEKRDLDIGITLTEWINECGSKLTVITELDWYKGKISLIAKVGFMKKLNKKITCVTEYPRIAEGFFKKKRIKNFKIQKISGSSEGLVPEMYNCCIDCVETGKTIKRQKLNEEYIIIKTKTVLVKRSGSINKQLRKTIKLIQKFA